MLTPIPLTQNPPPGSTGFGPGPRVPASVEFGPKAPQCPPRAAAPASLISAFPQGHPKPIPAKKEVSGPQEAAETRSGQAHHTCETPHLRSATNRRPPGLPRAHPLGAGCCAATGISVPAGPRATGARGASSSQWLPLPLRLPLPPPSPPPQPLLEAGTRRAQDSTAMSAAPRTALWGEGKRWGRRRERKRRTR